MNTHEQLKEICDKIGYENKKIKYKLCDGEYEFSKYYFGEYVKLDVREIIFTQEFMDKFGKYISNNHKTHEEWLICVEKIGRIDGILKHLDNPVTYLYNLIK